ncbi:MAG: ABC transporter permease [Actinomycetales bacterium]
MASRATGTRARFRRNQTLMRRVVVTIVLAFFAAPLIGMLDFTTRLGDGRSAATWAALVNVRVLDERYPILLEGILTSLAMAVITVLIMLVLLVPTMTWVRLRLPRLSRTVEFVCLLPLTIPAIVLVVGLTPVYSWLYSWTAYLFGSESGVWLSLAYVVLVLPYAYRAIDAGLRATDVKTLSEAARSLGAGWGTVMWRVILPNLRTAVLSASFLSVALVLGEFTIANLFNRINLQVAMYQLGKSDAQISVAVALASLVFAFVILFAMSFVGNAGAGRRPGRRARRSPPPATPAPSTSSSLESR